MTEPKNDNVPPPLSYGVASTKDKVLLTFSQPIRWFGLSKEDALAYAKMIRKQADKL